MNQGERLVATPGETTPDGFHIVGVGASAGGLAATTELLRNLGPEPGVAIVIVHQPEENSPSVKRVAAIRLDPEMLTETPGGRGAALSGGSGRIVIWGTMTLTDNDDWRIKTFFEYWRKRLAFIQALPNESYHEANVLVWAALDALSNLWAARVGKTQAGNRKERNQQRHVFDAFLAAYGGDPFQRVSLPHVWHRIVKQDLSDAAAKAKTKDADEEAPNDEGVGDEGLGRQVRLDPAVTDFLRNCQRENPSGLGGMHIREVASDPDLGALWSVIHERCPDAAAKSTSIWLKASRYGSIAYKTMRSSFIHEGRPGDESHSFRFRDSPTNATYMSRAYSNRPVIGFHPSFMTLVLERCIDGFEAEAVASRVDPVLPRNRHEAKQ